MNGISPGGEGGSGDRWGRPRRKGRPTRSGYGDHPGRIHGGVAAAPALDRAEFPRTGETHEGHRPGVATQHSHRRIGAPPPAPDGAPKVLYVGDSIATETRNALASSVNATGKAGVVSVNYPSTTIGDYFPDHAAGSSAPAEQKLPALVQRERPLVVVLQFWGRARSPCLEGAPPSWPPPAAAPRSPACPPKRPPCSACWVGIPTSPSPLWPP